MRPLSQLTVCLLVAGPVGSGLFRVQADAAGGAPSGVGRVNVLLITADDLNYDSLGVTGCKVPEITPHIDRLASEGMRFEHAHVTIAVCQPSRSVLMTGRYPHRNGAKGFEPIRTDVPTLQESLRAAGYLNGIMAKVGHLAPGEKFCWDTIVPAEELGNGRDPELYYKHARSFFERARNENRPFFLMANSQDPHRPFAGSEQEANRANRRLRAGQAAAVGRTYKPQEVVVPGFLPDLPDIRTELAQYFTSVHRCDQTVGKILKALKESGLEQSTLVMFLSDNGMSLPFSKTNCYPASTRTPWIVRWPGKVKPGTVDKGHFISGIDFTPTILEATGLKSIEGVDGRSFVGLLRGEKDESRGGVFTLFFQTSGRNDYPMRAFQTRKYVYIWNPWSDGKTVFKNEPQAGLTFKAMQEAARTDPAIAARVRLFLYRVPEEFYDVETDPNALQNLIDDPALKDKVARFRQELSRQMTATDDPLAERFRNEILQDRSR
ncbi:MAG: sulfatase [Phycisphaerae bacterium]|nr:sulfatase [Phycisphaerae bacterium]